MTDKNGKFIGSPVVEIHYVEATPELVEQTRRNFEDALSRIRSRILGYPVKVTVDWGEKPEGYGKDRTYTYIYLKPVGRDSLPVNGMDKLKGDKHHDRNHDPDCTAINGRRSAADGHRAGNRRSCLEETGPETGGAGKSLGRSAAQGDYPGIDEEGMK